MFKQPAERLRNAATEAELLTVLREAESDPIVQSRIIDMMTHAQLQTVSTALLASAKEQLGPDFVQFISTYVPVTIALQRAIAKTDMSVPDPELRRHLMAILDD